MRSGVVLLVAARVLLVVLLAWLLMAWLLAS